MKIAVLGTGMVGKTLAGKLGEIGHDVRLGTRDPGETLGRPVPQEPDAITYQAWLQRTDRVELLTLAEAVAGAQLIFSSLKGSEVVSALSTLRDAIGSTPLVDTTNPLSFPDGGAPVLTVSNTDSLGEQIQRALPAAPVVKALNTLSYELMVAPGLVGNGNHVLPICGNSAAAKTAVTQVLQQVGWPESAILDLGDISNARGMEAWMLYWFRIMAKLGTARFGMQIVT